MSDPSGFRYRLVPSPWPRLALVLLVSMLVYGIAWEALVDPLRPGSWLWLKVLPLAFAIPGLRQGRLYTFQWLSLLIWLYVCEALVRIIAPDSLERWLSLGWLVLSLLLTVCIFAGTKAARLKPRPLDPDARR
ncbi:MAG: hypothetical protein RL483_747 [Pseudomonadota bacterium]